MPQQTPVAFLSYAILNDKYDRGRLTKFRELLSNEVEVRTGEKFPIFQDQQDIQWGQSWEERLNDSLDEVTFLIPIITPSFFKSDWCRKELQRFADREKKLGRNDLILPVYYVECPILNDEARRNADPLAKIIASRQMFDWRDLRHELFTNPLVGRTLAQMATQIGHALERVEFSQCKPPQPSRPPIDPPAPAKTDAATPAASAESAQRAPSAKTEPPILVVDPLHRGDYLTISDAIKAAQPGTRILVRPGFYTEGLEIDKPLEILGDGPPQDIVVQATGKHTVQFKTTMGRIANLTLRQAGGGEYFGVDIAQGRLELEDCDISSQSLSCVGIHNGADPRLRRNRIHDGKQAGVVVYENGLGNLEDNDIFGNTHSGVEIKTGGNPTLRNNRIHDSKASGVFVYENGQGNLEDNDIFGNALTGVQIKTGGNPTLRNNRIHDGKEGGVFVQENGLGSLKDNDIFGNSKAGVGIKTGGNPTLGNNRIHDGKASGIFVYENGLGNLEDNDIFGNAFSGVATKTGGSPTLRNNRIHKNSSWAIQVYEGGGGTFEQNDLRDNARGAWDIAADCLDKVSRSGNLE